MPQVIERLPDLFGPAHGEPVPAQLVGSKIIRVGTFPREVLVQCGGLVIDYLPRRCKKARRLVLEFGDRGVWVHSDAPAPSPSE